MNSPGSLPSRIHDAAHPSCCAGDVAGVECDLLDRIKTAIEETSTHVCSYCAEMIPVSLDEGINLASARAHMATCSKHPMHELLEAAKAVRATCPADPDINREWEAAWNALVAAIAKAEPQLGEFHASADVEISEKS